MPKGRVKEERVEEDGEEERKKCFSCTHSKGPAWHLQHFFFQSFLPLPLSSSPFHSNTQHVSPSARQRSAAECAHSERVQRKHGAHSHTHTQAVTRSHPDSHTLE